MGIAEYRLYNFIAVVEEIALGIRSHVNGMYLSCLRKHYEIIESKEK